MRNGNFENKYEKINYQKVNMDLKLGLGQRKKKFMIDSLINKR